MQRIHCRFQVATPQPAVDFLAQAMGLARARIKDCMAKGGVWRIAPHKRPQRIRRAQTMLHPGEVVEIWYAPQILNLKPPALSPCLAFSRWSVWEKPPGIPTQGSPWGDHLALTRLAATALGRTNQLHPVYRLDTQASGLVLLAHDAEAMAALSRLLQQGEGTKVYAAVLAGSAQWDEVCIMVPVQGKPARTQVQVVARDATRTWVQATLVTGRRHQLRIHAAQGLGMPVWGDVRYGGPPFPQLLLACTGLGFRCPFSGAPVEASYQPPHWPLPPQGALLPDSFPRAP